MPSLAADLRLLSSLRGQVRGRVFESFRRLYEEAFPLPNEQQDPAVWFEPSPDGQYRTQVLVAGTGFEKSERMEVWGGAVVEHYPVSQCGLLAYLVVDASRRGQGLGRRLVDAAIDHLLETAQAQGQKLQAVFGEAEDFRRDEIRRKGDFPAQRLVIQHRLGARWIDIPYVMPRLARTKLRDPNLLLLAFPDPRVTLNATTVRLAVVDSFLAEYYAREEANPSDPRSGDEIARMRQALIALAGEYHKQCGWPHPGQPPGDHPRDEVLVPLKALPAPGVAPFPPH